MERRIGPFFAVLIWLVGGALLMIAVVIFVFYGYCEDYCDKPPRARVGGADRARGAALALRA
jgi:hypothetical protein